MQGTVRRQLSTYSTILERSALCLCSPAGVLFSHAVLARCDADTGKDLLFPMSSNLGMAMQQRRRPTSSSSHGHISCEVLVIGTLLNAMT